MIWLRVFFAMQQTLIWSDGKLHNKFALSIVQQLALSTNKRDFQGFQIIGSVLPGAFLPTTLFNVTSKVTANICRDFIYLSLC